VVKTTIKLHNTPMDSRKEEGLDRGISLKWTYYEESIGLSFETRVAL